MDADERRYETHGRDAGDGRRWAQWGTVENSASAHRATAGPAGRSGAEYGRPAQPQRQPPRGSGDLPKLVHFVSAAADSPSATHGDYRNNNPASSSSGDLVAPQQAMSSPALAPGSLASNTVVAKMMKRMNYKEGAGLGRHDQGIVAPIEVIPRPKNAGLGIVEGSVAGAFDPPPSADNWPKWDEVRGAKKQKRRHQELDEKILAKPLDEESAAEAVARVHKALTRASRWSSSVQGVLCHGEETTTAVISMAMDRVQSGTLTMAELVHEFTALKEKYPQEYTTYRLADAARAIVAPLLRAAFRHWEPLEDPSRGLDAVTKLKDTLLDDDGSSSAASSPYAALVDDVVVGAVVASAAETWDAKDPDPMVRFLEMWGDALPLPAIQRVLEELVMPKLSSAVDSWEPGWDAVPCHDWVHPWIPQLGHRMLEPVYATVRVKLGELMGGRHAHAARASAVYGVVTPWKDAFGAAAWGQFVDGHVVPYVRRGIREVRVVTPPGKEDGGFGWVVRWAPEVVSARAMAWLMEEEGFFCKWHDALRRWLWDERPGVEEAVAWHDGWKRRLTPELLADERVRAHIEVGLQMITRAAKGLGLGSSYRPPGHGRRQHDGEVHSFRDVPPRRAPPVGYGRKRRQY